LIAARKGKKIVEKEDFLDAVDRIIGGLEKKNKIIPQDERKAVAYHEAGHATISWLLEHAHPLIKVTIVPRGKALGAAWYLPEERQITTREQMYDEICAALAGRAAEEVVFGTISTGALNDLEKVTKQAYAMVSYFGMSEKIGTISFYDSTGQNEYGFTKPYSEKTAEMIDQEVKELVQKAYVRAKEILMKNKKKHEELAELLLEKEVIFSEDLVRIFGERKNMKDLPMAPSSLKKRSGRKTVPSKGNGKGKKEDAGTVKKKKTTPESVSSGNNGKEKKEEKKVSGGDVNEEKA
jgi:cell division protease FtsH